MIYEVCIHCGDTCGNYDINHWGYVEAKSEDELRKVFIGTGFREWVFYKVNLKPIPKTILYANYDREMI